MKAITGFVPGARNVAPTSVVVDTSAVIDGRIELGGLLYETLATGLDPYPRRAGASFEWTESPDEAASATAPGSPFAALSRLRGR